jgi:hypothetical protein
MIDLYMWDKLKNENLNLYIERGVLRGKLTELTNQLACKIVGRKSADDEMIAHLELELQRIKSIPPKEVEVIKEVIKIEKVPVEVIKEVVKIKNVPVEVIKEVIKIRNVPVEVIKEVVKIRNVPVEVIKEVVKIKNVPFKDPADVKKLAVLTRKHEALKSRFDEIAIRISDVNNK